MSVATTARLYDAAFASYVKNCGPNAVAAAESDVLGQLIEACRFSALVMKKRIAGNASEGEYNIALRDCLAALAAVKGEQG